MKILIVDDNRDLADGIGALLEDENHEVVVTYSGQDAIQASDSQPFDIVLIDVKLTDMSGLDVYSHIRTRSPSSRPFLITGFRTDQVLAQCLESGNVSTLVTEVPVENVGKHIEAIGEGGILLAVGQRATLASELYEQIVKEASVTMLRDANLSQDYHVPAGTSLVILDIEQPLSCALVALRQIHKDSPQARFFINIRKSVDPDTDDPLRSLNVTGCLFKPFDPDQLLTTIERLHTG